MKKLFGSSSFKKKRFNKNQANWQKGTENQDKEGSQGTSLAKRSSSEAKLDGNDGQVSKNRKESKEQWKNKHTEDPLAGELTGFDK